MFLFILESLGTSELILIGILALVLLGPRKLPDIARKAGKIMAEFRGTANEFKETWQREVNFEEEAKALREMNLDEEVNSLRLDLDEEPSHVPNDHSISEIEAPAIREADPSEFEGLITSGGESADRKIPLERETLPLEKDKKTWL